MELIASASALMKTMPQSFENDIAIIEFVAPESFKSPRGVVQGGLIGGFMDEIMGFTVLAATRGKLLPLNLEMSISYLKPVPIGKLIGKGKIIKLGRRVAFMEGELYDEDDMLLIRSTSTAMLTEVPVGEV